MFSIINKIKNCVVKYHYLNYGRGDILDWCTAFFQKQGRDTYTIMDIGCGYGHDLKNIRKSTVNKIRMFGIEINKSAIHICEQSNITIFPIDIEKTAIPIEDHFFDIVIMNQVIEHTKEIFFIFSEVSRILKPDGIVIIGVPNLASFHNRILLFIGQQPTCIDVLGPHIRGFTIPSLKKFIETDDYFHVSEVKGANFYPFPPPLSIYLSRAFPGLSVSILFLVEKTEKGGNFVDILIKRKFETVYRDEPISPQ